MGRRGRMEKADEHRPGSLFEMHQVDAQKHLQLQVCVTAEEDFFRCTFFFPIFKEPAQRAHLIFQEKKKLYFNVGVTMDTESGRGHYYLHAAAGIYPED